MDPLVGPSRATRPLFRERPPPGTLLDKCYGGWTEGTLQGIKLRLPAEAKGLEASYQEGLTQAVSPSS